MHSFLGNKVAEERVSGPPETLEAPENQGLAGLRYRIGEALSRTRAYYLKEQHPDGYWWYELESNVTMTAEYLMLLHFLGLKDEGRDALMANHILRHQRADGAWAIHYGGKGDVSTTAEAYFALKLAGMSADAPPLERARRSILSEGGVESCRVFTKIFFALFGQYDWKRIPSIPVEIMLLPDRVPFSIYSLSSWARSTLVPLTIVSDVRPVQDVPWGRGVEELFAPEAPVKGDPLFSWKKLFQAVDKALKLYGASPIRPLKGKALELAKQWVVEHQEESGDWGGIQPPMIYCPLALYTIGYGLTSEPLRKGLEALDRFTIRDRHEIRLQSCISPIWDTALTGLALLASGLPREHPSLQEAARWLAGKQVRVRGDWSVKRPEVEPGGWAFEFENSLYPDVDDTAVVLMFLHRYRDAEFMGRDVMRRGLGWVMGMQSGDGGWGAFDADNALDLWNQMPVGDLEAMTDPSTPDLTGRSLEVMGLAGLRRSHPAVVRATRFLKKKQEAEGCWWGRWGVNYIYGTWSVLMGLRSIGENMSLPYVRKAAEWLEEVQNPDGGWGECCESYEDPCLMGRGESTPSQTAWALMGLMAAGGERDGAVRRGVRYLLETQRPDGTWEEEAFTGTGFPKHFMLRYHNYRNCFPLMALGMYLSRVSG
jgi:squalene-hopene/tetraprenyl-beta-curcumene cyclase